MVQKIKRAYKKPELEKIYLIPEEAVLRSCKMSGATGPSIWSSNCISSFFNRPCRWLNSS